MRKLHIVYLRIFSSFLFGALFFGCDPMPEDETPVITDYRDSLTGKYKCYVTGGGWDGPTEIPMEDKTVFVGVKAIGDSSIYVGTNLLKLDADLSFGRNNRIGCIPYLTSGYRYYCGNFEADSLFIYTYAGTLGYAIVSHYYCEQQP